MFDDPNLLKSSVTFDHLVTLSAGGSRYDPQNLALACELCNHLRSDMDADTFRSIAQGVIRPRRADPEQIAQHLRLAGHRVMAATVRAWDYTARIASTVPSVNIRHWPAEAVTREVGWSLPRTTRADDIKWTFFMGRTRAMYDLQFGEPVFDPLNGVFLRRERRYGYRTGDTITLVDHQEMLTLRTMKRHTEAARKFLDGCGNVHHTLLLLRHGRDRMTILRWNHGHGERDDLVVHATSGAAARRIYRHLKPIVDPFNEYRWSAEDDKIVRARPKRIDTRFEARV